MKNFFKKLSFVLAIAMVLTSIAPATASAAEISATYVPAKKVNLKVNSEKVETFEMNVGDTQTVKVGLPVTKAAKEAGFTKSTFKTAHSVEGTAVEVVRVGNRTYEVTAVEAGEATITIGAAKNNKKAQAGEFKKLATVVVTVKAPEVELTAKQTGANKITVVGADLTDAKADYVVKRGNVTLSVKEVTVNDDKTEAVITSASSNMPAGDYTLSFKGSDAVEFTAEAAAVAKIVVEPEVAILNGNSTTSAIALYRVYNQFDEDVTATALGATVQVSGSDNATINPAGVVTFTNTAGFTMNLSQVSLALVCNTNGVNTSKILTVSEKSKLTEVAFAGVYKSANGTFVPADLAEGMNAAALANYYLFFTGVDQYGLPCAQTDKLQVNLSSITGLAADMENIGTETVNNVTYIKVPVKLTGMAALGAGDVTMLTVCLNSGKTLQETVTVAAATKIQSLTIYDTNGIYGAKDNTLSYEAIDTAGNAVTDFASLSVLNNTTNMPAYPALRFVRNADGSATLKFNAPTTNASTIPVPHVLTVLSPMNVFTSANVSILPDRLPKAIIGVSSLVDLGATNGHDIVIGADDLVYEDQYGNVLEFSAIDSADYTLDVKVSGNLGNFANVTTGAALTGDVFAASAAATTTGAVTVEVALKTVADGKVMLGSDYTFKTYCVNINDLSDFTIKTIGQKYVETTFVPTVYGYYAGNKVTLADDEFEVVNGQANDVVSVPAINPAEGIVTKEATVNVLVDNAAGTLVSAKYNYSNAPRTITTVDAAYSWLPGSFYYTRELTATSADAIDVTDLTAVLTINDQYEDANNEDAAVIAEVPYVTLSNLPEGIVATNNGSQTTSVTIAKDPGYYTIHVKYAWLNGVTFEQDVTIHVTQ